MRRLFPLLALEILLFSGCFYHIVNPSEQKVYVDVFSNLSLQPGVETRLCSNMRKTFSSNPGFILAGKPSEAQIVITGSIVDFPRAADFYSKDEKVLMGGYTVKIEAQFRTGAKIVSKRFEETFHQELTTKFDADSLLDSVTDRLSRGIYFYLLKTDAR